MTLGPGHRIIWVCFLISCLCPFVQLIYLNLKFYWVYDEKLTLLTSIRTVLEKMDRESSLKKKMRLGETQVGIHNRSSTNNLNNSSSIYQL